MNEFNEFPLAKEYFLEAISRWPADANLHHNLGYLYAECLQDKDQAAICLNKALELDPGNQNIKQDLDILISDQE
jgi:tetratricopeptide (TPR) repeat protein